LHPPLYFFKALRVERSMLDGEREGDRKYSRKVDESEKSWETWEMFYYRKKKNHFSEGSRALPTQSRVQVETLEWLEAMA
jgi:hypothetical protein